MEAHDVFGDTRRLQTAIGEIPRQPEQTGRALETRATRRAPFFVADGLQDAHRRRGLTLETLADVVGVGSRPVLEEHLSGLAGPGQGLEEVLHLVGGAAGNSDGFIIANH